MHSENTTMLNKSGAKRTRVALCFTETLCNVKQLESGIAPFKVSEQYSIGCLAITDTKFRKMSK